MVVLTQMLTPCVCTLQVQRMLVLTQTLTPCVCTLQVQRMLVLTQMLTQICMYTAGAENGRRVQKHQLSHLEAVHAHQ